LYKLYEIMQKKEKKSWVKTNLNELRCRESWVAYLINRKLYNVYKDFKYFFWIFEFEFFNLVERLRGVLKADDNITFTNTRGPFGDHLL
jgi:hypothetical protein